MKMTKALNIKVSGDITIAQLETALRYSGLYISRLLDGGYFLSNINPGDCDICGRWASRLIDGACTSCNENHNLETNNMGYES